jgi:hypothetical protein
LVAKNKREYRLAGQVGGASSDDGLLASLSAGLHFLRLFDNLSEQSRQLFGFVASQVKGA